LPSAVVRTVRVGLSSARDSQSRRRSARQRRRSAGPATPATAPTWDWSFETDGALALDSHEAWDIPLKTSRIPVSQTATVTPLLKDPPEVGTLAAMPSRRSRRQTVRMRQRRARARRIRRIVGLLFLVVVLLLTLLLTAFGTGQSTAPSMRVANVVSGPVGPPRPQVVAMHGSLPLHLPVPQERLTAIGFHAPGDGALALEPIGQRANAGFVTRLIHRIFGGDDGKVRYYQLSGGHGAATGSLDVGAPAGTDVYTPLDGTVVGISDYVLNGERYGAKIDLQPAAAPSLVVSLTRLKLDPNLTVGSSVGGTTSKLGTVLDLSRVEEQALARYTHDAGNHVSIEVHPTSSLALP
jgi:hypothetical protein